MIQGMVQVISESCHEFTSVIGRARVERCADGQWYCTRLDLACERKVTAEELELRAVMVGMVASDIKLCNATLHQWQREDLGKPWRCAKCGLAGGAGSTPLYPMVGGHPDEACPDVPAPQAAEAIEAAEPVSADGTRINTAEEAGQEVAEKVVRMKLAEEEGGEVG